MTSDDAELPFLVAIGASAGGLKALEAFFRALPEETGLPFVVVQHLSQDYRSFMPEIMRRFSDLQIKVIEHGDPIRPGVVHLLPPGHGLEIVDGLLELTERSEERGVHLPIDNFLVSLASGEHYRPIAVILSGSGSDGSRGVRAIKQAGGIVAIQEPSSAGFDGMPRSAMATGMVDLVLPPDELARAIVDYSNKLELVGQVENEPSSIRSVLAHVLNASGVDFSEYRSTTLRRRIANRMAVLGLDDLVAYSEHLRTHPREVQSLFRDLVIGVTRFFRDPDAWELLATQVVPALCDEGQGPVRVWSVGCSTGEEPYTLAALFRRYLDDTGSDRLLKIFATDIDQSALRFAAAGRYPEAVAADIPDDLLERYFHIDKQMLSVRPELRNAVVFSRHDVLADPPFSRLGLVCCRNMLIYVNRAVQERVLHNFTYALEEGGYYFQGSSESLGDFVDAYSSLSSRWRIHQLRVKTDVPPMPSRSRGVRSLHAGLVQERAPAPQQTTNFTRLYQDMLERFGPAVAVVSQRHEVLVVLGEIDKYLRVPPGRPSMDLMAMARHDLGPILSTLLHKVRESGGPVEYEDVIVREAGGTPLSLSVYAEPAPPSAGDEPGATLIVFRDLTPREGTPSDVESAAHLADLQGELQFTKESLHATIEELETANEELQSMNEELLSSNEELQSTNEELQSVNEELITVNAEYGNKIEELSQLQADVDNLFRVTGISTLFLDRELRIRRFSSSAAQVFELVPSDVGRPIGSFASNLDYDTFVDDLEQVLSSLTPLRRNVRSDDEHSFVVDIFPYESANHVIQGLVCTFQDTTEREALQHEFSRVVANVEAEVNERIRQVVRRPLRLLFVYDSEADRQAYQRAFSRQGSELTCVASAAEALEQVGEDWDMVLVDARLGGEDGTALIGQMRAAGTSMETLFVVLSGHYSSELAERAYRAGASLCMQKPDLPDHVSAIVSFLRQAADHMVGPI